MGTESYNMGGGTMYFNPTSVLGYRSMGSIFDCVLTPTLTEQKHYTPATGQMVLDKTHIPRKEVSIKFKADELSAVNLNAMLFGDSAGATDASYVSGSAVDEVPPVGDVYKDRIFFTTKGNISSVVLTNSAGAVTYVLDTDYSIVDAVVGAIKVITAGAITNGQSLKIDYAYAVSNEQKIKVLANPSPVEGKAIFVFKTSSGLPFRWIIPKCNLRPSGELTLATEAWNNQEFVLDCLLDTTTAGEPFGKILQSQTPA